MDYANYRLPTPKKGARLDLLVGASGGRLVSPKFRGNKSIFSYGSCGEETAYFITGHANRDSFYRSKKQRHQYRRHGWSNNHMNWVLRRNGFGLLPINSRTTASLISCPGPSHDGRQRLLLFDADFGHNGACYTGSSYFTYFKGKLRHAGDPSDDHSTKERLVTFLFKHEIHNAFVVYDRKVLAEWVETFEENLDDKLREAWGFDPVRMRYCGELSDSFE